MADISGKKVAILVDDYFEQAEFTGPRDVLKEAGANVTVISTKGGEIHGLNHVEPGDTFQADLSLDQANPTDYDALVLPGGAVNADSLRMNDKARDWAKQFMEQGKVLAAICHAPWLLVSSGLTKGKKLTSYFTIQDDMRNGGADWTDEQVVEDGNLVTSRQPDDVPAFSQTIITKLQVT